MDGDSLRNPCDDYPDTANVDQADDDESGTGDAYDPCTRPLQADSGADSFITALDVVGIRGRPGWQRTLLKTFFYWLPEHIYDRPPAIAIHEVNVVDTL